MSMRTFIIPIPKIDSSKHTTSYVGTDVKTDVHFQYLSEYDRPKDKISTSRVQENLYCVSIITLVWRFGENKIPWRYFASKISNDVQ